MKLFDFLSRHVKKNEMSFMKKNKIDYDALDYEYDDDFDDYDDDIAVEDYYDYDDYE